MKKYAATIKIALLIAAAVILFQMISLLSLYQYVRTDLYLSLVAVCFLTAGLLIARRTGARPLHETAANATFPERSVTTAFPERFVMSAVPEKVAPQRPVLATLLTQRELQILQHIAEGKTNKEIAAVHFVEISTVKTHVNNIYTKLAVSNRMQARLKYTEMMGGRAE